MCEKFSHMREWKTLQTGASARHSQFHSSPILLIWSYQVCRTVFPANGSNLSPGSDQLKAVPLSSPERPSHTAIGLMTRLQILSSPFGQRWLATRYTLNHLMLEHNFCNPWLAQKSKNKTPLRFRSGKLFLPISPLQVTSPLPIWALKSPKITMESPGDAPFRTPPTDPKKAGYSELLLGVYCRCSEMTLSLTWEFQHQRAQLGGDCSSGL